METKYDNKIQTWNERGTSLREYDFSAEDYKDNVKYMASLSQKLATMFSLHVIYAASHVKMLLKSPRQSPDPLKYTSLIYIRLICLNSKTADRD